MIRGVNKAKLKRLLRLATGCTIQHDGWTCGTCFFSIIDEEGILTNEDWQNVLLIRGDYREEDLKNLPRSKEARIESYNKIIKLCEEEIKNEN